MKKKTVNIDEGLHTELKALAVRNGTNVYRALSSMIEYFLERDMLPDTENKVDKEKDTLKKLEEDIGYIKEKMIEGFVTVTTNQDAFGRSSEAVFKRLLQEISEIQKGQKKQGP